MSALPAPSRHPVSFTSAGLREHLRDDPDLDEICRDQAFVDFIAGHGARQAVELIDDIGLRPGSSAKINLYKAWLARAREKPALAALMWFNLATEYDAFGDERNKVVALENALAVHHGCYQAAVNLGLTFETHRRTDVALARWREALQGDDARVVLLNNIGRVLENRKELVAAKAEYTRSLLTRPDQPSVLHHLINLRQKTCDWPIYRDDIPGVTREAMVDATRALSLLAIEDDVAAQSRGNAAWIAERMPAVPHFAHPRRAQPKSRLRIGYLSTDFCMHPIAYLIAELLETHDRAAFEIHGFCATTEDGSEVRRRIVAAFDRFVSIRDLDDEQAAELIRSHDIDVLIELNGLTLGTRLQVLRWRPAPLQITYLGYNGPIPLPELDYIIADRFVIPETLAGAHRPAPLYMPDCFQVNDRKLAVRKDVTRTAAGLPEGTFVFCGFSNTYKVTESVFAAWMDILRRTEPSVLWLYVDNEEAIANLRAAARRHGVDDDRIIFARRVEPSLYRGQLALADLFLDTFPYNAGTTASDALRVGLPLLTISGESFISRMAGSLLTTMDLADCIASDIDSYVDLAVRLATNPEAYRALRVRVDPLRWVRTLGDTERFCRALEGQLREIVEVRSM